MHAVIFDIDGTLIDSSSEDEEIYKQAVEHVLGKVRFRPGLDDYDHVTDAGILLQTLEDNGVPPDDDLIHHIQNEFCALIRDHVVKAGPFREIPGARTILRRLHDSDIHAVAIATGGWQRSAIIKLETAGFDIGGIPLASSDDALDRTSIMQVALASIGDSFESVTYFGDGPWDQQACVCLGWSFCSVGPALNGLSSFAEAPLEL